MKKRGRTRQPNQMAIHTFKVKTPSLSKRCHFILKLSQFLAFVSKFLFIQTLQIINCILKTNIDYCLLPIVVIVALFFFINWLIYKLIGLVFGGFLSFIAIIMEYYYSARTIVRYFVFPGSFKYNTRGIEFQWGQQMAAQIGETSSNFR